MTRQTVVCALLSGLLLVPSTARPEDKVVDGKGFDPNRQYMSELPFEHIDPLTGNVLLTFTDLVLPGNAGFDVRIQRTYNAKIYKTLQSTGGFTLGEDSWAGLGWTLHMGRLIFASTGSPFPACPNCPIAVEMPDGRRSALFPHIDGVAAHMTTKDFWTYQHGSGSPLVHRLRLPNGVVYHFEESTQPIVPLEGDPTLRALYVNQIVDAFGNSVRITYRTGPLAHLIERIDQNLLGSPPRTRTITFGYTETIGGVTARSLSSMTYSPSGRPSIVWNYHQSRPSGLNVGYTMLDSVDPPEGPAWTYDYYEASTAIAQWTLSGVTTPNGATIDYVYRRHAFQNGANVSYSPAVETRTVGGRLPSGGAGAWTYGYVSNATANVTTITAPCGFRTVHRFLGISPAQPQAWKLGALESRRIESTSGTLWEEEALTWQESPVISNVDEGAAGSRTKAALLRIREITRPGDPVYTTTHTYDLAAFSASRAANFANYGRPHTTTESGQLSRTIERSFFYFPTGSYPGFSNYIVDKLDTERLNPATENFTTNYEYRTAPYQGFAEAITVNGIRTDYALDATGYPESATDERGLTTSYTYDWGVLENTQTPLYLITQSIYAEGLVGSQTRRGFTTTFDYDRLSRLTRRTPPSVTPASNPTVITYDPGGQFVQTTRGSSSLIENVDGFGRPANTLNAVNVRTRVGYDSCGRRTYESYPFQGSLGSSADIGSSYQLDPLHRITRRTNPGGSFVTYEYDGGTGIDVVITDEEGRRTVQDWSAFGNPQEARLMGVTAASGTSDANTTTYDYNGLGALTSVTPTATPSAGRSWTYYGASEGGGSHGQLKRETHPESGSTSYTYLPNGLLETRTDALSVVTTYGYDDNNRLTSLFRSSTPNPITIGYDDSDNRQTLVTADVSSTFGYDGANRLRSRTDVIGGQTFVTGYDPDGNDNVAEIRYHSGLNITYDYDPANRITAVRRTGSTCPSVNCFARLVSYHPSGGLASFVAGNGGTHTVTYDANRYWVTDVDAGGHLGLDYRNYDRVGNVHDINDSRSGFNQHFDYDNLDRLTTANGPWGGGSFGYDTLGNRTSKTIAGDSTTYTYAPATQRLMNADGDEDDIFGYDLNGNLRSQNGRTYTYTPENMLETATVGTVATTYRYDGDNLRKIKDTPGSRRFFVHGLGNQLLSEWQACAGGPPRRVKDNVYLGSRLLASVKPVTTPLTASFIAATATVSESDTAATMGVRLVTGDGTPVACPVTVTVSRAAGSAVAGLDFVATPQDITFPANSTSGTVLQANLAVINDSLDEDDGETYTLGLGSSEAQVGSPSQVAVGITDNDLEPVVTTHDNTVTEGDSGLQDLVYYVTLDAPSGRQVQVDLVTADITARAGADYVGQNKTLVFAPGTTSQPWAVPIIGERVYEPPPNEIFWVRLLNPVNATVGPVQRQGAIVDNDTAPTVSVSDCSLVEGHSGSASCAFTVKLSNPSSLAVSVSYATAAGTATIGTDYQSVAPTPLTFAAETDTRVANVSILGDTTSESHETFLVNLSSPSNVTILDGLAIGTILDDEADKYYTVAPCRVLDTRQPVGPSGGPILASGELRSFPVTGLCGVPAMAKAVMLNVTMTAQTQAGSLKVFPAGLAVPATSVMNFSASQPRANNATVLLGTSGQATAQCSMATAGQTHLIVDVFGYYR